MRSAEAGTADAGVGSQEDLAGAASNRREEPEPSLPSGRGEVDASLDAMLGINIDISDMIGGQDMSSFDLGGGI
jgi:hypothetical protein